MSFVSRINKINGMRFLSMFCGLLLYGQAGAVAVIANPDWNITLSDFGYADLLFDSRPGFAGREYLSGEHGAAVAYTVGGAAKAPTWLEPHFLAPDWTTNSNFSSTTSIAATGTMNIDGYAIYSSMISNPHLNITMTYEMLDTVTGIAQGIDPASSGLPGSFITSSRYILRQNYSITNTSGALIQDLQLFQFLHGLRSQNATYDNQDYAESVYSDYNYDMTLRGIDEGADQIDTIAFHSTLAPSAWEAGRYGIQGPDDHIFGKPVFGVHLDIEGNSLDDTDFFETGNPWVGGAQRFELIDLNDGESVDFDILLSLSSVTASSAVPLPAAAWLFGFGLLGLLGMAKHKKV